MDLKTKALKLGATEFGKSTNKNNLGNAYLKLINKKKNNVGNYNRFHTRKLMINEVLFGSMESSDHLKYILIDELGEYGASPKHTVIIFEDESIDDYICDLCSPVAQLMLSIMKDYNHNDSKLFAYLPFGISSIEFTQEETEFLGQFGTTGINKIHI